jgi:hypothetical protein
VRWYLNRTGQAEGPYEEAQLLQWIVAGAIVEANVCPEGGTQWLPIAKTPPFAGVLGHGSTPGMAAQRVAMPDQRVMAAAPPIIVSGPASLPVSSGSPPSSGIEGLPPAPWVVNERPPGFGSTQRIEDDLDDDAAVEVDRAWRDAPGVVDRIGRRTASQIPPAGELEISKIEAPLGTRTPAEPREAIDFGAPLPESAPVWMHHAQGMIAGLTQALEQGHIDPSLEACVERAWAGWQLDGSSERQIARLALLVEQTHNALREMPPHRLEGAVRDCAEVLRQAMPKHARKRIPLDDVVLVTRKLSKEADAWVAVVNAVSGLLGWQESAVAHAAHAIRLSLQRTRKRA